MSDMAFTYRPYRQGSQWLTSGLRSSKSLHRLMIRDSSWCWLA